MFKKYTSPNFNDRKDDKVPAIIVLHYTGMKTAKAALERLCDPASEVSAHFLIEENGKTHALVPVDKRAWHAGASYWAGESDLNSASIGIEIVNPGHEFGYSPFPEKQIKAVKKLCKDLMVQYKVPPHKVLGHSDIAISRKIDPGHLFPWCDLAKEGIGLWSAPIEMDYQAAEDVILNPDTMHELLCGFGYDPQKTLDETLVAFHRHYAPEKFESCDDAPINADIATIAKLLSLIRQAHEIV